LFLFLLLLFEEFELLEILIGDPDLGSSRDLGASFSLLRDSFLLLGFSSFTGFFSSMKDLGVEFTTVCVEDLQAVGSQ